ncbi:protein translocase subunit SecD [Myxococcota bacterium]|nr:protein translocase subunit SecD [Myxococcota bacterium]MBU1537555.1 protein translocase subunit SecD [Myxococcota bacterium]
MERKWFWRVVFFGFFGIFSVIYLLPTFVAEEKLPKWFNGYFNKKVLRGLDLAGGVHLEYAIDTDIIIEDQLDGWGIDIKTRLMEEYGEKDKDTSAHFKLEVRGNRLEITFLKAVDTKKLEKALSNYLAYDGRRLVQTGVKDKTYYYVMDGTYASNLESKALTRAVETIRDRVDEFGVASPEIYRKDDMVVVELPGLDKKSQDRIKRIIMKSAHLEFKMVDSGPKAAFMAEVGRYLRDKYKITEAGVIKSGPYKGMVISRDSYKARTAADVQKTWYLELDVPTKSLPMDQTMAFMKARALMEDLFRKELVAAGIMIPQGREIGFEKDRKVNPQGIHTSQKILRAMLLFKNSKVTGEYIINAQVGYDRQSRPVVNATFNRTGGRYFAEMTGAHKGWKMAIKLDNWVASAPVIQDEIHENVQITVGSFGTASQVLADVEELVGTLKSGSLPAPLTKEMELNVGPSLGKRAIQKGELALGIGAFLVVLFMLVWYKKSGFIAVAALLLNVIFLMAIMAGLEARLTLPGMAGIVLTIGMAVDANVIIFERIREELRLGKNPRAAIDSGYSRAFWAIMDGQITTLIAGVVLYEFGTGPIKGFAVTLIIGIITSIVTGVFFTRVVFDFITSRKHKVESLSI